MSHQNSKPEHPNEWVLKGINVKHFPYVENIRHDNIYSYSQICPGAKIFAIFDADAAMKYLDAASAREHLWHSPISSEHKANSLNLRKVFFRL